MNFQEIIDKLNQEIEKRQKLITALQEYCNELPKEITTQPDRINFVVNGIDFRMIKVEGGTFTMGSDDREAHDTEIPLHKVTLDTYYIGETVVTQALWKAIMEEDPFECNNFPVNNVSWNDTKEFLAKLNKMTGQQFRLPTEAEWEYAARGGKRSHGYKYAGSNNLDEVGWYPNNSDKQIHLVKQKKPNELGLYDMSGNVCEWCQDRYGKYSSSSQTNPTDASSGAFYVNRGGSWCHTAWYSRVSCRRSGLPSDRFDFIGFRLAL